MPHEFRHLFSPLRVGGLTLKNRIFSTGHAEAMAEDGKPGARLRAYHEAKARGGAALTIIGGSTSVHPSSPASAWNMIANHDDSVIAGYRGVAEAVHQPLGRGLRGPDAERSPQLDVTIPPHRAAAGDRQGAPSGRRQYDIVGPHEPATVRGRASIE